MSNEYSREEQNALKTGLYVTLALIALSLFYVSGRKAVEHQESGSYYPVYARSAEPTACRWATSFGWPACRWAR